MHILVINSGSSSIKFSIFGASPNADPAVVLDGQLSGIGSPEPSLELRPSATTQSASIAVHAADSSEAIHLIFDQLAESGIPHFDAVGYRIVHPGPKLDRHQRITPQVLADLEAAIPFAPLHEPGSIKMIREAMERHPDIPHYACFDTIFHQTMPEAATTYPIPLEYRDKGVHRYGFHGLSCESVVRRLRHSPAIPFPQRMIIAHLGSGCSITALLEGKSIDNTMGLTPTGGVIMGTRPGDLDPGLVLYLLREPEATLASVERTLNHSSGIKALFGINDMKRLRDAAGHDARANLALDIFCTSGRRAIGGMAAVHGVDAIVFTGGIGEHDPGTRWALANGLYGDQPEIEPAANEAKISGLRKISAEESNTAVYVVPAEEDLMIALHVVALAASDGL